MFMESLERNRNVEFRIHVMLLIVYLDFFMMITKPNQGSILVINFSVGKQEVNQASVST